MANDTEKRSKLNDLPFGKQSEWSEEKIAQAAKLRLIAATWPKTLGYVHGRIPANNEVFVYTHADRKQGGKRLKLDIFDPIVKFKVTEDDLGSSLMGIRGENHLITRLDVKYPGLKREIAALRREQKKKARTSLR